MKSPSLLLLLLAILCLIIAPASAQPVTIPKVQLVSPAEFHLTRARIESPASLQHEAQVLRAALQHHNISPSDQGTLIRLVLADVPIAESKSRYRDQIAAQAYAITIGSEGGILIEGSTPQAIYYGIQTLDQMLNSQPLHHARIVDWPDLPLRMIMIDPARQNENFEYYRRVIDFCARYKINSILCHLTDDQTSALHDENYPELMHPHAWKQDDVTALVQYARERHIELIPEIESLGHSRMFTRRADYADFLHQRKEPQRTSTWTGTDIEGYTNVLCPASDKAADYLRTMYARADAFQHPWLHIGFDEVDITQCDGCISEFGEISKPEWIKFAFERSASLARERNKKVALWGDMLLAHPESVDAVPPEETIIFDWHYNHDVTDESVQFFDDRGYEIVACPALVCAPHVILPDEHNYQNIARFTAIAREHDLLGVNTTIWIPARYMSDSLWPGIAYAASHAWGGSNTPDDSFFTAFVQDHFGSADGAQFFSTLQKLNSVTWHVSDFGVACWDDEASLAKAQEVAVQRHDEITTKIATLQEVIHELEAFKPGVGQNVNDLDVLIQSVQSLQYIIEHLRAAPDVKQGDAWNKSLVADLDRKCTAAIDWVMADWNKNRYPGDPNLEGLYLTNQHLLYKLNQMHAFHQQILESR